MACALFCVTAVTAPVAAQSLRDAVKDHVKEGLEKSQEKSAEEEKEKEKSADKEKEKKSAEKKSAEDQGSDQKKAQKKSPAKKPAARKKPRPLFTTDSSAKPEDKKDEGPDLPLRVIGRDLRIDLKLGMGYRGWLPQQYPTVKVEMVNYLTWAITGRARIFRWLVLRRAYYESSGLSGPRTSGAAVASEIGSYAPKAAWVMGQFGFPFMEVWEPVIGYESRAFKTYVKPDATGVCVIDDDFPEDADLGECQYTTDQLRIVSGFETLIAGVRYNHHKDPDPVVHAPKGSFPPIFFGVGLMSYTKPYQVTIDGFTLKEVLFDGRFRGAGIAFGTELGGGVNRFYADIYGQLGLGQVSLTEDLTLNELAPEGWLIGYLQGDVTVGYRLPLWDFAPTLMFVPSVTGGGASFFFFKTESEEGEKLTTPGINWDFLWSVYGSLVLSL